MLYKGHRLQKRRLTCAAVVVDNAFHRPFEDRFERKNVSVVADRKPVFLQKTAVFRRSRHLLDLFTYISVRIRKLLPDLRKFGARVGIYLPFFVYYLLYRHL